MIRFGKVKRMEKKKKYFLQILYKKTTIFIQKKIKTTNHIQILYKLPAILPLTTLTHVRKAT